MPDAGDLPPSRGHECRRPVPGAASPHMCFREAVTTVPAHLINPLIRTGATAPLVRPRTCSIVPLLSAPYPLRHVAERPGPLS
jgi:hypothetical protein